MKPILILMLFRLQVPALQAGDGEEVIMEKQLEIAGSPALVRLVRYPLLQHIDTGNKSFTNRGSIVELRIIEKSSSHTTIRVPWREFFVTPPRPAREMVG